MAVLLRGVMPSILRSLYDIETNKVHMFLDNLLLRNNAAGLRQRQLLIRPMEAEFDLIAYMPEES